MKTDDVLALKAFSDVAQFGNFAKASKGLTVPVSVLSKRVAKLEGQLGVRLFQRSTRVVTLTDEGTALLPKVRAVLDGLSEIEATFDARRELTGTVKIASVPFVAQNLLIPVIREFQKRHPKLKVELFLQEKTVNLIESGIDLAVRIAKPDDSDLIYRKLVPNELVLCASPRYLKRAKKVRAIEDLHAHDLLFLRIHHECKFTGKSVALKTFTACKRVESDNGAFLTELALKDFGILVRSLWDVKAHLESGRLVRVLEHSPLETFGHVYAVVPSRRYLAPRVRAFWDCLLSAAQTW